VDVRVRLVDSGQEFTLPNGFRYVVDNVITSISPPSLNITNIVPVTLFGQGFQAPISVSLAGITATVISVSATEVVVMPGRPFVNNCQDLGGPSRIVNINTGDVAVGPDFIYFVEPTRPVIASITPNRVQAPAGGAAVTVTIAGPNVENAEQARFGTRTASVSIATPGDNAVTVTVPQSDVLTRPACPTGIPVDTLLPVETVGVTLVDLDTNCGSTPPVTFTYVLPCTVPTPTPVPSPTVTPTP
jgi:hypothetical protein